MIVCCATVIATNAVAMATAAHAGQRRPNIPPRITTPMTVKAAAVSPEPAVKQKSARLDRCYKIEIGTFTAGDTTNPCHDEAGIMEIP